MRFTGSRTEIRILKLVNYKVSLDDEQGIMVKICVSVLDDDKATIIKSTEPSLTNYSTYHKHFH